MSDSLDFKLRNVSNASNQRPNADSARTMSTQGNGSPFKVPEVPRKPKARKLFTHPHLDPAIIENVRAMNEMTRSNQQSSREEIVSSSREVVIGQSSNDISQKTSIKTPQSSMINSPEMEALFDAVIGKNAEKVEDCLRSSLGTSLNEILNLNKPKQNSREVQNQLEKLQSDYNSRIKGLQTQNDDLSQKLNIVNNENDALVLENNAIMKQSNELMETIGGMESKNKLLTIDLKIAMEKIERLVTHERSITKQNAGWQSEIAKFRTEKSRADQLLIDLERKNSDLQTMNETLMQTNRALNSKLHRIQGFQGIKYGRMTMFSNTKRFSHPN